MLKKLQKPMSNSLECVELMLKGAKKRRKLAASAINSLNSQLGFTPNIMLIK